MQIKKLTILLLIIAGQMVYAQTSNQQKAREKGREAIKLMEAGKFDESIPLLEEAQKLAPDDINYPYELAYAYYAKQDYKKASKYLESLLKHKDVMDLVYQLLGNSYDITGKRDKAIKTYEAGLQKFPNSGKLYLELGIVQMVKKDYDQALSYYEKGIEVEPSFSSNYYWAAKFFCNSTEKVWGLMYGEIFMNLEPATKRSLEISELLFETYKNGIKIQGDSSSVDFSRNTFISPDALKDTNKIPFNLSYGLWVLLAIDNETINIYSLNQMRNNFIDNFYKSEHNKDYPNILFERQKDIKEAGHMEAYNHWLLREGDPEKFEKWLENNESKMESFSKWFFENPLKLNQNYRFHRKQY